MQIGKLRLQDEVIVSAVGIIGECLSLTTRLVFVHKFVLLFIHLRIRQQKSKRVYPVWLNSLKFFRANWLKKETFVHMYRMLQPHGGKLVGRNF